MKSIKGENLYTIGQEYLDKATQGSKMRIKIFRHLEIRKQIRMEFEEEQAKLVDMSQIVDISQLKKFLKMPQINNTLIAYLQYTIYFSFIRMSKKNTKEPKKEILMDDVVNYFLRVIETHFLDMPEPTIIALKSFVDILASVCSLFKLHEDVFSEVLFLEEFDSKVSFKTWSHLNVIQIDEDMPNIITNACNKIKYEINSGFVPQNSKYNRLRSIYIKAMKSVYQLGFVYLLGEYKFNEFYISPLILNSNGYKEIFHDHKIFNKINKKQYRELRDEWRNIFVSNDIIYIVGGPGFGKSLFLKNIINNYSKLNIDASEEYLLIYCDLKAFYSKGNPNKKSVIDFLQESMINSTGLDEERISKEFIQYHIDLGRCVILLDALDEVPKEVRGELHKKIVGYFSTCNPNNKICITSRDRGFFPQADIEVFEICPLTSMDIEDYLDKMISLNKFKKDDKKCFMEQAQVLIDKNFLNNFLALSLLVSIYKSEKKLPENKTNLYKKCFEYIAKEREIEEKDQTGFNWKNVAPLMKDSTFISLSTLGIPNNKDIDRKDVEKLLLEQYRTKYGDEAETECAIKEFLDFCSSRTELFVPSSVDDKFKFFHRSFFEYFYSRYIHQCAIVEEMYELMSVFDVDSEVFELTVALVKEDNEVKYQKLISHLLSKVEEELSATPKACTAFYILTLAMQVIDDAYFKQRYFEIIIKHSTSIILQNTDNFNQKLVTTWVSNVIDGNPEKLETFKDKYEERCIIYLLTLFSNMSKEHLKEVKDNIDEISFFAGYSFMSKFRIAPFYVYVYVKYVNIFEKMECYNKIPIDKIIGTFHNLSRSKRNEVKKGFSIYKSLNVDIRRKVCDIINKL